MPSLLEISIFTVMRRFDYRDGGLGGLWLEKLGAGANKQQIVGKGMILWTKRENSATEEPKFVPP